MKLKQLWTNGQIHNHFETKKYKCLIFHLIQISQFWFDQFFFILCYIYNNILLSSAKSVWFCCYTAPFSIFLFIQIFRKGILNFFASNSLYIFAIFTSCLFLYYIYMYLLQRVLRPAPPLPSPLILLQQKPHSAVLYLLHEYVSISSKY